MLATSMTRSKRTRSETGANGAFHPTSGGSGGGGPPLHGGADLASFEVEVGEAGPGEGDGEFEA